MINHVKYFVIRHFRGTSSSVKMLKGYMLIFPNADGVHCQRKVGNPWSKDSSNDVASAAITAPVPSMHRPSLILLHRVWDLPLYLGRWMTHLYRSSLTHGASENFVDFGVCHRLNLPVDEDRSSIGMASSEISVETLGKTTADLNLLDRTYPSSNFRVLKNLCADVIVGQTFLRHNTLPLRS